MKPFYCFILLFILSCCQDHHTSHKTITNIFYEKAWENKDLGDTDHALVNFYKAKDIFLKKQDTIGAGKSLINIGIILTEKGDYFGAQETSLEATKYFNENNISNYEFIKSNYNNLGIASYNLKDYDNALKFYDLAIKFSNNPLDTRIYLNNKAKVLQDTKKYNEAINIYNQILENTSKNKTEYARTLTNLAKTKWLEDSSYNPIPELKKSLDIRIEENDSWGQNSSYAHIADYYIKENKVDSALFFAKKMYLISKKLKSPDDQIEALQKLILTENPENSKKNFLTYQKLNDSITLSRSKAKNQFALIKFDVEKIKTDNAEKQIKILQRNIGIATLSSVLILGAFWGLFWYKRRQRENELKIKENQLRLSKKVHDVVANGIYQVMTKIENQENFDKDRALDELEFVYEKSRDISYAKPEINDSVEFAEDIFNLISSFESSCIKTFLIGNSTKIWKGVNEPAQNEIFQIIRELLVNMKKHSQATLVAFKFERNDSLVQIQYTDNGIGIPGDIIHGNGLTNTVSRIEKIKGTIIFDNKTEKGLKIYISFPAS